MKKIMLIPAIIFVILIVLAADLPITEAESPDPTQEAESSYDIIRPRIIIPERVNVAKSKLQYRRKKISLFLRLHTFP